MNPKPYLYLFSIVLLFAYCNQKTEDSLSQVLRQTESPTSQKLRRAKQHFLIRETGDSIPTGIPIPTKGKRVDPDSVAKPKTFPLRSKPKVVPVRSNVFTAGKPKVVPVPKELTVISLRENSVPLPDTAPARGKIVPAKQPQPVPALPPQMKETAVTDIRSYTTLSESMTVKENFQFLNAYLKRIVPAISENNGLVQQFLGDGIMALFLNGPEDAVKSSIAYQKAVALYNRERLEKGRRPLSVGIGLNTGALMMGVIGHKNRMSASVVSDVVNTASRMEGLTKHFGVSVIVSEETIQRLEDPGLFHFRYLGKVQVKGKKQALNIYECFDGDPEESFHLKVKTKADFEKALQKYHNQHFEDALILFRKILQENPTDQPALLYQNRAANFIAQGVVADWTGVEVMMEK